MSRLNAIALAIAGLLFCSVASAQVQRSFVASYGSDANVATNCGFANPCRGFTAAHGVTNAGGEIVALDAAGYGAITITKSISIIGNPGFYAGISASTGNAITIATASVNVLIRGLNINGIGGTNGISMTNGASLTVENCVISGFPGGSGIFISAANANARVTGTILRGNFDGVWVENGNVDVSTSKAFGNGRAGFLAFTNPTPSAVANLTVSDSVSSHNQYGFASVVNSTSSVARLVATRLEATHNSIAGGYTLVLTGTSNTVSTGYSTYARNAVGLQNDSGTFESLGNNVVRQNTAATSGTITTVALQ